MKSFSVHYGFSQHFDAPPRAAYAWCTDYDPEDIDLGGQRGKRSIRWLNEDVLVLTDTYFVGKRRVVKKRLVKLYPERLWWTNTRISREGRYSQFLYQIVPERGGSRLYFTGSQMFAGQASAPRREALAKKLAEEDSALWRNFAKAMAKDLAC
jgi:hypothetical protein